MKCSKSVFSARQHVLYELFDSISPVRMREG